MTNHHGLWCCNQMINWKDLNTTIRADGEGGLLWEWSCPHCGALLRADPFNPPPVPAADVPWDKV